MALQVTVQLHLQAPQRGVIEAAAEAAAQLHRTTVQHLDLVEEAEQAPAECAAIHQAMPAAVAVAMQVIHTKLAQAAKVALAVHVVTQVNHGQTGEDRDSTAAAHLVEAAVEAALSTAAAGAARAL